MNTIKLCVIETNLLRIILSVHQQTRIIDIVPHAANQYFDDLNQLPLSILKTVKAITKVTKPVKKSEPGLKPYKNMNST